MNPALTSRNEFIGVLVIINDKELKAKTHGLQGLYWVETVIHPVSSQLFWLACSLSCVQFVCEESAINALVSAAIKDTP